MTEEANFFGIGRIDKGCPLIKKVNKKLKILGDFLKSRRNRLQPAQAGFNSSYGHRRTPGLRREEVAILAGVSATYYTWIEQGREVTASREVIENIANALQLTSDERTHLLQLWSPTEPEVVPSSEMNLNPQWQRILNDLSFPSFISNERSDVLAWNSATKNMFTDFSLLSVHERNMIRMLFVDPEQRQRIVNWEEFALHSVALFRGNYDKHPEDPWFETTVQQLCEEDADFADMWNLHQIEQKKVTRIVIHSPSIRRAISYDINFSSNPNDDPNLHFCIFTPVE
ncbi:transcriptional regulator with XRE-family HTH domain [Paenibacillus sp. DS2015]|uniref:helix-turn-helix transcriptional regulator n=1 Tax=Paenibacillus sp. DS2015 TaxID=3373917 RepID=UPI003D1EC168